MHDHGSIRTQAPIADFNSLTVLFYIFQECASLADRLIQGQVTRAQEAEEMFVIKKELAKMKRKFSMVEETESVEKEDGQEKSQSNGVGEEEDRRDSVGGGGEKGRLDADVEGRLEDRAQVCVCVCVHVWYTFF